MLTAHQEEGVTRLFRCGRARHVHKTRDETLERRANSPISQEFDELPQRRAAMTDAVLGR